MGPITTKANLMTESYFHLFYINGSQLDNCLVSDHAPIEQVIYIFQIYNNWYTVVISKDITYHFYTYWRDEF